MKIFGDNFTDNEYIAQRDEEKEAVAKNEPDSTIPPSKPGLGGILTFVGYAGVGVLGLVNFIKNRSRGTDDKINS